MVHKSTYKLLQLQLHININLTVKLKFNIKSINFFNSEGGVIHHHDYTDIDFGGDCVIKKRKFTDQNS